VRNGVRPRRQSKVSEYSAAAVINGVVHRWSAQQRSAVVLGQGIDGGPHHVEAARLALVGVGQLQ